MNYYIYYDEFSPERILSSIPKNLTPEMALHDNDIIFDQTASYNTDWLLEFMNKLNRGIPDRVIIATFGIDGPAVTSLLQYDGNMIRLTIDSSRNGVQKEYTNFYGYQIDSQIRHLDGVTSEIYYLVTTDNQLIPFFTNIMK